MFVLSGRFCDICRLRAVFLEFHGGAEEILQQVPVFMHDVERTDAGFFSESVVDEELPHVRPVLLLDV